MPLYRDQIFPRVYDLLMGFGSLDSRRAAHLATAKGKVLEVGIGTGLNLSHYPSGVTRLTGLDCSEVMLHKAKKRAKRIGVELETILATADQMPFEDDAFDVVVSTHSLCSLNERTAALREIRRVLKPDGRFLFLEHGLSPDPKVAKWQHRLNGIQRRFAAGCCLDIDIEEVIREAGFSFLTLDKAYQPRESKTHGYLYEGVAVPV